MSLFHNPRSITDGLVAVYDAANLSSFRGNVETNISTGISIISGSYNTDYYKASSGTEIVYIPQIGYKNVSYVDFYNDYPTSGNCCPSLFSFGDLTSGVSGSTTYTYSIIYKTNTGYTHPNYMYRYENNGSTYVSEAGVHNDSNRTHLGNGWYHAWGQFTTQPTTNRLVTYLFHYEYATYNRIWVAAVSLTQGTAIPAPQHMLAVGTSRGATVGTGGGWIGMASTQQNATLVNAPAFENIKKGVLTFNGTNQYITSDSVILGSSNTSPFTLEAWALTNTASGWQTVVGTNASWSQIGFNGNLFYFGRNAGLSFFNGGSISANTWYHLVMTFNGSYAEGYLNGSYVTGGTMTTNGSSNGVTTIGAYTSSGSEYLNGKIALVRIYNRSLTASEVLQNYNATKGRFA